jgi:GTP-binding protein
MCEPGWGNVLISSLHIERGSSGRLFTVALLGRVNVGKSTLFNRLLGRRRAITHSTPGVTRDALSAEMRIKDLHLTLIDSGGYNLEAGEIEKQVAARSACLAEACDLILLLVEVAGLTGEDLELIERLRRHGEKLILVVNKVDSEKAAQGLGEFHELGFSRIAAVSAVHGRSLSELKELIYQAAKGREDWEQLRKFEEVENQVEDAELQEPRQPRDEDRKLIRLAILGKPNTGKSTLLNRLLEEDKALVTDIPGTTRDPVQGQLMYKHNPLRVIDTAGMRRKSKVSESVEYYSVNRSIKSIDEADVVLLLIDASEGISDQDKKITALAARRGRGIILVLNKWDLLVGAGESTEDQLRWREVRDRTRFLFPTLGFAPLLRISALDGSGLNQLLETVLEVSRQLNRRVATPRLNRALKSWVSEYPLPVRGKNVKIRYATQTGVNPVSFLFFVNDLKHYPRRYNQYLAGRIRRELGFDKIPVFVDLRES